MLTKPATESAKTDKVIRGKLFTNGRSQPVHLRGVLLEPVQDYENRLEAIHAMFARIDECVAMTFFPSEKSSRY